MKFSPDGRLIVVSTNGQVIRLIDAFQGTPLQTFVVRYLSPLPDMPVLGSSNSAADKDMMSKIWTNRDTIFCLSRKPCGKRRNCSLRAISSFPTMFSKAVCC